LTTLFLHFSPVPVHSFRLAKLFGVCGFPRDGHGDVRRVRHAGVKVRSAGFDAVSVREPASAERAKGPFCRH